jgi:hypothetical protein
MSPLAGPFYFLAHLAAQLSGTHRCQHRHFGVGNMVWGIDRFAVTDFVQEAAFQDWGLMPEAASCAF